MQKSWRQAFSWCLLALCLAGPAHALDLSGTLWEEVGQRYELDPVLLYAVALAESARTSGRGVSPWPWTLNDRGNPAYFSSESDAAAAVRRITDERPDASVDIGMMQVNFRVHGKRLGDPVRLLSPSANLQAGAAILSEAMASAPDDRELGIGRYHSWTERRARVYGKRVLGIFLYLKHLF